MKRNAGELVVATMRWLDAVNAPQDSGRLTAACTADMVVERMGVFDKKGAIAEVFRGYSEISAWLDRLPEGIFFELAGGPEPKTKVGQKVWSLRYLYRIPELQFSNGGAWLIRLADDGRLCWLRHDPDPLPDGMGAGGRDQGGQPSHPAH